jgi:hypothetical protein
MNFLKNPRGLRNNNPGNIRLGNDWVGEIVGNDSNFETFKAVEYGIRALHILLDVYARKYNAVNAHDIIHRFAPMHENQTNSYIISVVAYIQKLSNKNITSLTNLHEENLINHLIAAIIQHENSFNPFSIDFINSCKDVN